MRIIHISDLHYGKFSFNPLQLFSKRLLGNLNFLFRRQFLFDKKIIDHFEELLPSLKPTLILISGDLTTTALNSEFKEARSFFERLSQMCPVFAIPGNHDTYTKKAYIKKTFYKSLEHLFPIDGDFKTNLKKEGIAIFKLGTNRHLLMLDCSESSSYFLSTGHFNSFLEKKLEQILAHVPSQEKIILCCHYPLFNYEGARRRLVAAEHLQKIIERYPNIDLYLHGHTHRHTIADLRGNNLPLISDAGSLSYRKQATFNVIDSKGDDIEISPYYFDKTWGQKP